MAAKPIPIMTGIATSGADDDLLAALLRQLPVSGPFPGRATWDQLWKLALDLKYGPTADVPAFLPQRPAGPPMPAAGAAPTRAKQAHAGHDFYIARDGTACNADGVPVLISDIPAEEMIFDYRPVNPMAGEFRDVDGIVWADGARGTAGIAPGCSFCGPGTGL